MDTRNIDYRIKHINFLCAILIVLQHGIHTDWISFSTYLYQIQELLSHISRISVPIFFFISGYLWMPKIEYKNYVKKCGVQPNVCLSRMWPGQL